MKGRTDTRSFRRAFRHTLLSASFAVFLVAGTTACGEKEAQAERTDDTTLSLLNAREELGSGAQGAAQAEAPATLRRQEKPIDVALLGFDRGKPDAPVRVVEMSDYGCGYCRRFHEQTWPTLNEEFVAAGKVEWKFLPFVSGMFEDSDVVTEAAECVLEQDPELFEVMNGRLWDDQRAWKSSGDPLAVVRGFARDSGADMARWDSCMKEGRRKDRVQAATALARQLGVRGTPTFFVVGYPPLQGALPTETFRNVLNMVYADATQGGN
ncbi:MAG: DsbA family protein [Gemmatimonadota bacterium]